MQIMNIQNAPKKFLMNEIGETISFEQFRYTINRLAWHKSSEINGTSPNALKSLDDDDVAIIFELRKDCT